MTHPVLDHTPHLRSQADRLELSCDATEWLGWNEPYAFRCAKGHPFSVSAKWLTSAVTGCRVCTGLSHLSRLQQVAKEHGLQCLATEWEGAAVRYLYECPQGHRWHHAPHRMLRCEVCVRQASGVVARGDPAGLARLQRAAALRGGQCLSEVYVIASSYYRFRCVKGHEWQTKGLLVMNGNWCSLCADTLRRVEYQASDQEPGLARLREAAGKKGGVCLSEVYRGTARTHRFRCAQGHEWNVRGSRVLEGMWCKKCASAALGDLLRSEDGLQRLQALAAKRGGQCLSTEYKGHKYPVRLRCGKGHEWETRASTILSGAWCRRCVVDASRLSMADAHAAAEARGGQCLSETYVNSDTKLTWMCDRGHVWKATMSNVRNQGKWCAQCQFMARISNRKSTARIKYEAAGQEPD